jgi:hypothetical protein
MIALFTKVSGEPGPGHQGLNGYLFCAPQSPRQERWAVPIWPVAAHCCPNGPVSCGPTPLLFCKQEVTGSIPVGSIA